MQRSISRAGAGSSKLKVQSSREAPVFKLQTSKIAARPNGARTLVRRRVGWRRDLGICRHGSAVQAFRRDQSRAPSEVLVGALYTYDKPWSVFPGAQSVPLLSAAQPQPNGVRPSSGAETSDGNTCGSNPEPQTSLKLLRPGTAALRKFIATCEQFPPLQCSAPAPACLCATA